MPVAMDPEPAMMAPDPDPRNPYGTGIGGCALDFNHRRRRWRSRALHDYFTLGAAVKQAPRHDGKQ